MSLVEPEVLLNSIMGKIYNVLTNGDDTVPRSEDSFFSWCTPGIVVDPSDFEFLSQGLTGIVKKPALDTIKEGMSEKQELDPAELESLRAQDTASLYMQAENFARLVDFVPDIAASTNDQFAALSVMNNKGSLSERFEYVLRMSQVMESVLPENVVAKIEKFRGLLTTTRTKVNLFDDSEEEVVEPSALVNLYTQKMAAYENAALEYNTRRVDALTADNVRAVHYWAMNANILRNKVRAAMADWVSNGYKHDYEGISAFIDQVMQRDMALLKQQYRDDLEKARLTGLASGSDFYYTSCVPGNFMTAPGWTQFSFSSSDFNRTTNSNYKMKKSKTSAGGGWLGIFSAKGSTSKSSGDSEQHVRFNSHKFELKFSIVQVPIVRGNWFKTSFINSKLWRFDKNNPEAAQELVSDGGTPPTGLIPAYPTTMIVIKDLVMSFKDSEGFSDAAASWEKSATSGGAAIHFGPFHLGGSHGRSEASGERSSEFDYNTKTQEMKVPGYQIIGFKCHVNKDKSPDPLESITDWI